MRSALILGNLSLRYLPGQLLASIHLLGATWIRALGSRETRLEHSGSGDRRGSHYPGGRYSWPVVASARTRALSSPPPSPGRPSDDPGWACVEVV